MHGNISMCNMSSRGGRGGIKHTVSASDVFVEFPTLKLKLIGLQTWTRNLKISGTQQECIERIFGTAERVHM